VTWEGDVLFWDFRRDKIVARINGVGESHHAPVLSADGRLLLLASYGWLKLGDKSSITVAEVATYKVRARIQLPAAILRCMALSADGKVLATGCTNGSILLWDFHALLRRAAANKRGSR
jgi:WD40 repeat protein